MMYARSDIKQINVSDAFGGCGQTHTRPEGERLWGVECPACETFLRKDKLWAAQPDDIPETYDEARHREVAEKNAHRRQLNVMEQASGLLALLAGPRDLLAGGLPQLAAPGGNCQKCDVALAPSARFCGACGAPALRQVESGAA